MQNPKLESMHLGLLRTEEELKSKLHVLQENVLKDLAGAQGNILENQVKRSSNDVKRGLRYPSVCGTRHSSDRLIDSQNGFF